MIPAEIVKKLSSLSLSDVRKALEESGYFGCDDILACEFYGVNKDFSFVYIIGFRGSDDCIESGKVYVEYSEGIISAEF